MERARNLFEFLRRTQELKLTPARKTEDYQRDGAVLWLANAPEHPAVVAANRGGDPAPDAPLLTVDRVPRTAPPEADAVLDKWISEPRDDPELPPSLRDAITVVEDEDDIDEEGGSATRIRRLEDEPEVRQRYDEWFGDWQHWADQERGDQPVREFYNELFTAYVKASQNPEELELVAGVGHLAWEPRGHVPVRRHLLTTPVAITFDDDTARLTVQRVESTEALKVELDMLDPGVIATPDTINAVRADARELDAHPLHRDDVGALVRRLVHTLDADGGYREQDGSLGGAESNAVATFAPAIILRKRSQQGLVDIFGDIVAQLGEAEQVPDGIIPLVDPDHVPRSSASGDHGALVAVDDETFLPVPVNDKQRRVVERVDTQAQVLVQGPPGTGKTHTAGALISHLLAQGKRVLVTAHTDRALREVRGKLPGDIKPLAVSVVGTSREDMADLKVAVEKIATAAHEYDADDNARAIQEGLDTIDRLRRQRAELHSQLVATREREVREHEHAGYRGTLASIARDLHVSAQRHTWLLNHVTVGADDEPPLRSDEIVEWHGHLLDAALNGDEPESRMRLLELDAVPDPERFAELVSAEHRATDEEARYEQLKSHSAFDAVLHLDGQQRPELRRRLHELADEADTLADRREQWINDALADVRAGRAGNWRARDETITELIERARGPVEWLGHLTRVDMPGDEPTRLAALAREIRRHLAGGGKIKAAPDGSVKIGAFASKTLKQAQPLFDTVRVDGLPPTTPPQLDAVLAWTDATTALDALDRAWPSTVEVPPEDTLNERLQWHRTELEQLRRVMRFAAELEDEERRIAHLGLPSPDWNDLQAVRTYASLVDAAAVEEAWHAAEEPLRRLEETVGGAAEWAGAPSCVERLRAAVSTRDRDEYAAAHGRLRRLWEVRDLAARRDELARRLDGSAPMLRQAIAAGASDEAWPGRLERFGQAWAWASTGTWILEQEAKDVNELQAGVAGTEDDIRRQVEARAARRAWDHAASPERLTGTARADLTNYAQLVRRGGKLTGKHAAHQKAAIRRAMDNCRPSVPVWIMPIYRIADQLRIQPDMFDVVIVDEASQAGMEATFLQYLAAKIVVIGDDRQVSPAAVGVDQQRLRDLAGQHIAHDRYRDSWQDPQRSLFDEGKMRYGGLITLTEHRRCVPEIIGFSNRIAYEPDGIRLVPVRQYGADRLEPVKAVHLQEGYERGSTNKVNPVEADAIVDQIEKCLADPAYDGKTLGVISLLGPAQAKHIQKKLMDRIPAGQWNARDLRCGDASDFQGSERDVMFLSMVAAPEPGRRMFALTRELYVQRYNVAVSRAKDQVWVYHSIDLQELHNKDDMRRHLLEYCYGVMARGQPVGDDDGGRPAPEDRLVAPFESLFEQRVHNRITDRGYTVIPQYETEGYRIDLVVVGGSTRLAVECDGDHWHGPDAFERDLARQRDLERCGWRFFRVRESAFYVDPAAALSDLWDALSDLDIHPPGERPDSETCPASAAPPGGEQPSATGDPADARGSHIEQAATPPVETPPDGTPGPAPDIPVPTESSGEPARTPPEPTAFVGDELDDPAPAVRVGTGEPADAPPLPSELDVTAHTSPADAGPRGVDEKSSGSPSVADMPPTAGVTESALVPYEVFWDRLTPVSDASRAQLVESVVEIVAVEGPILGERLRGVYVRASGGQRVGKQIAQSLNQAISVAVRRGELETDDPLGEGDVKHATYRLPSQPAVRVRQRGPRTVYEVPPLELAALMALSARDFGWDEEDAIMRSTLDLLGVKRLTQQLAQHLRPLFALARRRYDT